MTDMWNTVQNLYRMCITFWKLRNKVVNTIFEDSLLLFSIILNYNPFRSSVNNVYQSVINENRNRSVNRC